MAAISSTVTSGLTLISETPPWARLVCRSSEALNSSLFAGLSQVMHMPLSPRETDVLRMVSRGLTNAEIAQHTGITVHTVKFHLAAVYRKLGAANRTEAAALFLSAALNGSTLNGSMEAD